MSSAAGALVVHDGKLLLLRRAIEPWRGAWCAPGGFCDEGEHPIETVEREALEETGLRVAVTGYIGVWVDEYADEQAAPGVDVINVAYYTAVPLGGPAGSVDDTEVSARRWFPRDELPRSLAPPRTLSAVLAAASTPMPIRDDPMASRTPPR
jgi:8-oxo-dGTP diphosphatase